MRPDGPDLLGLPYQPLRENGSTGLPEARSSAIGRIPAVEAAVNGHSAASIRADAHRFEGRWWKAPITHVSRRQLSTKPGQLHIRIEEEVVLELRDYWTGVLVYLTQTEREELQASLLNVGFGGTSDSG